MADGGWDAGGTMKANRLGVRVDQIGFRLLVVSFGLAVATWFLVCLAMVG